MTLQYSRERVPVARAAFALRLGLRFCAPQRARRWRAAAGGRDSASRLSWRESDDGRALAVSCVVSSVPIFTQGRVRADLALGDVFHDIMCTVTWDVEFTDEFFIWWSGLAEGAQDAVGAKVQLLELRGPALGFPHSSGVVTSRHAHLQELRVQYRGRPHRVMYAFDPRRTAILLLGGDKTGNDRFYDVIVRRADALYDAHLRELREEGLL